MGFEGIGHIKCVLFNVTYMVKLQDSVSAPRGPSSISAVAEPVFTKYYFRNNYKF